MENAPTEIEVLIGIGRMGVEDTRKLSVVPSLPIPADSSPVFTCSLTPADQFLLWQELVVINTQTWPYRSVLIFIQKRPALLEPKHMGNPNSQDIVPCMRILHISHNCV